MLEKVRQIALRLPIFWRFQIIGWGAFAIYDYYSRAVFWESHFMALFLTLILEPCALLLSTGLRAVYKKLGLRGHFALRTLAVVFVSSGVASVLLLLGPAALAHEALYHFFGVAPPDDPRYLVRIIFYWMIFSGWSIAYFWLKSEFSVRAEREQRERAAAAAQRAELQMLRLQLNPHFLFNTLNHISAEIPEQPQVALEMIHRLAACLRYSLDHHRQLIAPLHHEIEAMQTYLDIEQERFGDRLHARVHAEPGAREIKVPAFLLQPLVENAVKHGLNTGEPPWELSVEAWHEEGSLHLQVGNTGKINRESENKNAGGTGIANLKRRLELHYPGRHAFHLRQQGPRVIADITLEGEPCQV